MVALRRRRAHSNHSCPRGRPALRNAFVSAGVSLRRDYALAASARPATDTVKSAKEADYTRRQTTARHCLAGRECREGAVRQHGSHENTESLLHIRFHLCSPSGIVPQNEQPNDARDSLYAAATAVKENLEKTDCTDSSLWGVRFRAPQDADGLRQRVLEIPRSR